MTREEEVELLTKVRAIHAAMLARREQRTGANSSHSGRAHVAAPASAPHDPNDPKVKVMPRNWKGEDMRGRPFSECPPLFLGMLSHMLDGFADKNELDPERERYAKWDRENAEAARRWRVKLEAKGATGSAAMTQEELDSTF